jgi:hypothetical protein
MTWCELAKVIIDMDQEIHYFMNYIEPRNLDKMRKILSIYENKKSEMVSALSSNRSRINVLNDFQYIDME